MVEFPLLVRQGAKGFAAPVQITIPDTACLLTLILSHQAGDWPWLVCGKLTHLLQATMRG
jgi:hypothetical protein